MKKTKGSIILDGKNRQIKRLKKRIEKFKDIIWWLTGGNQNWVAVENDYDEMMKEEEMKEQEYQFQVKLAKSKRVNNGSCN